ncbi:hypothetical protein NW757_013857 [Fusarium falciforme]|nr:hypothetical protein NW757_013857 [Fusarium falciforme]
MSKILSGDHGGYTLQGEANRIFHLILNDPRLQTPDEVKSFASQVKFVGDETQPFYHSPWKCAEAQAGLLGYVGIFALAIAKERYGVEETVEVDVQHALLNGLAAVFSRCEDDWLPKTKKMYAAVQRWDHGKTSEMYRQVATNVYKTGDGKWYYLHGSMNPTPLLSMLDMPQHNEDNLSHAEIVQKYADVVSKLDSETVDNWSNNVYRVPGTICYTKEEFEATAHGKAIKGEPYYNLIREPHYEQPPVSWSQPADPSDRRPLSGVKVLELARAIAAPTVGRVCAALGATVIRVSCATNTELPITLLDGCIGKISVDINLKTFEGRKKLLELIQDADVFIDGYRPSVLEHLGFGRDAVLGLVAKREKGIVYCQENCYGWKGPWQVRPGWAQIADGVSGVGYGCGRFHGYDEAHMFPGPNADYLTGHAGAAGVLHALYLRHRQGGSYVTQCSLLVSDLQMISYGEYSEEQKQAIKRRNPVVGQMRHYDEIVAMGIKKFTSRGFVADRPFEKAIKKEYYQTIDGSPWGYNPVDVVNFALQMGSMRTDFPIGAAPPGYHLPQWTVQKNPSFEPIQPTSN